MSHDAERDAAFEIFKDVMGEDATRDDFDEAYQGHHRNVAEYAEEYMDSTGELERGSLCERYFDYESFGRDLEIGGDIWTERAPGGGIFVFWNT